VSDVYSIYCKSPKTGRINTYIEVSCDFCNISQSNEYFLYNGTGD